MRLIKRKTYHNFMRVMRMIQAKGYDATEAEKMTHRIFDQYESHPYGLSVLRLVNMIVMKGEARCKCTTGKLQKPEKKEVTD